MLYHCGLLDPDPNNSRLRWIRGANWFDRMPPEVQLDVAVFLNMPGFSTEFYTHTLGRCRKLIKKWRAAMPLDQLKPFIAENWLSVSREDCLRLAAIRPPGGNMPLICQLQAVQDLKSGMSQYRLGKVYGTTGQAIGIWRREGFTKRNVPSGLEWLQIVS